jgi:pilus assembly protein CpaB
VTWFLYHRIRRQMTVSAQTMKIVATARQMEPGTLLSAADLALLDWPSRTPLEGSFSKPEELIGRILLYPIGAREPLRESLLAAAGSSVGLTAKIPDGMRALAVETNDVNNVSGFLFPGARVDVLMTLRPEATGEALSATVSRTFRC